MKENIVRETAEEDKDAQKETEVDTVCCCSAAADDKVKNKVCIMTESVHLHFIVFLFPCVFIQFITVLVKDKTSKLLHGLSGSWLVWI